MTLGAVIRLLDGPLAPLPCASETAFRPCIECPDPSAGETQIIMRRVRSSISEVLDHTTLTMACEAVRKETALSYEI